MAGCIIDDLPVNKRGSIIRVPGKVGYLVPGGIVWCKCPKCWIPEIQEPEERIDWGKELGEGNTPLTAFITWYPKSGSVSLV